MSRHPTRTEEGLARVSVWPDATVKATAHGAHERARDSLYCLQQHHQLGISAVGSTILLADADNKQKVSAL